MGGDTDTNCSIAGSLFGSRYGFKELPLTKWKVLDFNPENGFYHPRPDTYNCKNFL